MTRRCRNSRQLTCEPGDVRRTPAGFVLAVGALVLATAAAGCTQGHAGGRAAAGADRHPAKVTTTTAPPTTTTTSLVPVTDPPVTPISWAPCNGGLQCGSLTVPLDYADPANGQRSRSRSPAIRPRCRRTAIGSLVIDPGGPGVSGVDDMANELSALDARLLDDFDIVMFDPRGVDRSDPVTCGETPGQPPGDPARPRAATPGPAGGTDRQLRQYGGACEKASGTVLPYRRDGRRGPGHGAPARSLGDSGLTYMGQSYGSLLGLTYASLFPTHVRAMVLDSVIDPALTFNQLTAGAGRRLRGVAAVVLHLVRRHDRVPVATGGDPDSSPAGTDRLGADARSRPAAGARAGAGELYDALLDGLYSQTTGPSWATRLAADAAGNGAQVVAMSDHYNQNGSSNGDDAGGGDRLPRPPVSPTSAPTAAWPSLQDVGARLRAAAGLGRGLVRGVARAADPHGRAGRRAGRAAHPGRGHHG